MKSVSKAASVGFSLAIVILLGSGLLSYLNLRRIGRNEALVVHTHTVLDQMHDILATLSEAESGQRSYLITGDARYLVPYAADTTEIGAGLDNLQRLTVDDPVEQERISKLRTLIAARTASLHRGISLRDKSGAEAARAYVLEGQGRREMNSIRDLFRQMDETEFGLLKQRETESRVSYRTALVTLWSSTVVGLVLVGAAFRIAGRELETRRRSEEALEEANNELEGRVERRTQDLNLANESLQRSNRELEQFASVASHDLQEPLRKIQAFGDRLQVRCSDQLGEQGRDYLARMQSSAARMRSLIDALLSFSRITTKAQPFVPVNLANVAEEVVSDLEVRVQQMEGSVEIGELPTVEADPLQMRQLFQNLVGNGLKFARPNQPPVVRVESRMLPRENGEIPRYEIAVRDNGIGFEETYLDRIFELFQRLHGRQEYEGTGMGLAICRKIVERHGGEITARSAPNEGATFLVTLPTRQEIREGT
jgi:signal transduction histidine kinase